MKKRLLSLLLTAGMCAGLVAGCGGGNTQNADNSGNGGNAGGTQNAGSAGGAQADEGEKIDLNLVMISMGLNLEDAGAVQDAINAYIEPLINANVSIEWLDMGDYVNQMNLKLTGGDVIDVMPTFGTMTSMWYAQEALRPMDDLIETYGQGVMEAVGEEYLKAGYINGQLYGSRQYRNSHRRARSCTARILQSSMGWI